MSIRVLWITNQPIASHRNMLNLPLGQSGGWMEKSYECMLNVKDIVLGVVTIYNGSEILHSNVEGKDFYLLPSRQSVSAYDYNDSFNQVQWAKVISDFKPDLIHVWGTEYPMALCALKVAVDIPSVVYMQGMLNQLANHYCDGVSFGDQIRNITLIDIKRWNFLWSRKKQFEKASDIESKILNQSQNIIVESDWCAYNCLAIAPGAIIHRSSLPISSIFFNYNWSYDQCEKYSIFTVAGGYPIKGHHVLLKAFAHVVKLFPSAKLYIPGTSSVLTKGFINQLKMTTYDKYIRSIIKKYNLQNNVIYTGRLTPEQMAQQIEKCHVYVMPSSCENHSSSLIEAMIVGAPTISSYVGGISQYYKDGDNGFFYRFDEPEVLASLIINYFQQKDLAVRIAEKGRNDERSARQSINISLDFKKIYNTIMQNNTK